MYNSLTLITENLAHPLAHRGLETVKGQIASLEQDLNTKLWREFEVLIDLDQEQTQALTIWSTCSVVMSSLHRPARLASFSSPTNS